MNDYNYLKSQFPFYIICGIVFGLALFMLIAVHQYNDHLSRVLSNVDDVILNKNKIVEEIQEMDNVAAYFKREFDIDVANIDTELYIFQSLDEIKRKLQNAAITVTSFEKVQGKQELPVSIVAQVKNYKMILDYVKYIESFRIPDYEINNISIVKDESGKVILNIKGSFIMPKIGSGV